MKVKFSEGHTIAEVASSRLHKRFPMMDKADLYQEAWIGIMKANGYDPTSAYSIDKYLYGAATNKIMQYIYSNRLVVSGGRHRTREAFAVIRVGELGKISEPSSANTPEKETLHKERIAKVRESLMAKYKQNIEKTRFVELLLSGEHTADEAAEILHVAKTKVYEIAKSAKQTLRSSKQLRALMEE